MKRLIFLLLAVPLLTSCAQYYYQIATISSDQLELEGNGIYSYATPEYVIQYDFWDNSGVVRFSFENKTDSDIYIDLSRSFLVVNGIAQDYYQNRTWTNRTTIASTSSSGYSFGNAKSSSNSISSRFNNYVSYQPKLTSTIGFANTNVLGINQSYTVTSSNTSGIAVEEKEGVWVPAHTSKIFNEFSIMSYPYRECGFDRFPSDDKSKMDFTVASSPVVFENRLYIKKDGVEIPIKNTFYISNLNNLSEKNATYKDFEKNCNGKDREENGIKTYMKDASPNKFYVKYINDGSNDKIKKK